MKLSDQNRQWLRKVGFQFNNTSKHPEYFLRVTDNVKIIINIEGYVRVNNHLVRRPRTFADIIDWLGDFGICLCPSGDYAPDDLCPICEDNYTEAERRRTVKGGKKAKRSKESSKEKGSSEKEKAQRFINRHASIPTKPQSEH